MLNKIASKIIKEGKILAVAFVVGVLFATGMAAFSYVYSHAVQRDIAENVIRFHVRANSDSPADQYVKDQVRTEVLAEFEEFLASSTSIEETRAVLTAKLCSIQAHAEQVVRAAGFDCHVAVQMATVFFPTQFYGDIAFPPGEYEAVKIIIGEGVGSNWWCLMFPPLCYVDMTATDNSRELLASNVTEEGFRLLTHQEESRSVTVRFRVVEWWQNRNQPVAQRDDIARG